MFAHLFLSRVITKLKFIDLYELVWGKTDTSIMVNSQMYLNSITVTLATDKYQSSLNPFLIIEMEKTS